MEEIDISIMKQYENIIKLGLVHLNRKYGKHITLENELVQQVIKDTIEYVEITFKNSENKGNTKLLVSKELIRRFLQKRNEEYDLKKWDNTFTQTINQIVYLSKQKNPIIEINQNNQILTDVNDIFDDIFSIIVCQIRTRYTNVNDLMNNVFEIISLIIELLKNYKQIENDNNKKKLIIKSLMKNIVLKLDSFYPNITDDIKNQLNETIEGSFILIELGIEAKNGNLNINKEEATQLCSCFLGLLLRLFRRNQSNAV